MHQVRAATYGLCSQVPSTVNLIYCKREFITAKPLGRWVGVHGVAAEAKVLGAQWHVRLDGDYEGQAISNICHCTCCIGCVIMGPIIFAVGVLIILKVSFYYHTVGESAC